MNPGRDPSAREIVGRVSEEMRILSRAEDSGYRQQQLRGCPEWILM